MKLNKIITPSMKDLFIKEIENLILSGQLKVGQKLPTEREMAQQMKVSRTIINSGLNELAHKGFIEIFPRQGTFVSDFTKNGNLETLVSIINFNGGRFDRKTFKSLIDFRRHNEGEFAYKAASNRSENDIVMMENIYKKIKVGGTVDEITNLKFEFHHIVACASGNTIYPLVLNSFKTIILSFISTLYNFFGVEIASEYMEDLIKAIKNKNGEMARNIMVAIIDRRADELEEKYFDF